MRSPGPLRFHSTAFLRRWTNAGCGGVNVGDPGATAATATAAVVEPVEASLVAWQTSEVGGDFAASIAASDGAAVAAPTASTYSALATSMTDARGRRRAGSVCSRASVVASQARGYGWAHARSASSRAENVPLAVPWATSSCSAGRLSATNGLVRLEGLGLGLGRGRG